MSDRDHVVVAKMEPQRTLQWDKPGSSRYKRKKKQLLRNIKVAAAVSLCLGAGGFIYAKLPQQTQAVMSHIKTGFEYDETLGRLQYVSSILPESAMVFLSSDTQKETEHIVPASAPVSHEWSQKEPWIEYDAVGDVVCCQDGEIVTVVKNSSDTYTIRMIHANGYESLYSGLSSVHCSEGDQIRAGEQLGTSVGFTAFELRKDGLSIMPVFKTQSSS